MVGQLDKLGAVCSDLGLALFKVAKAEEAQVSWRGQERERACVCTCVCVCLCVCVRV